jgi:hypothetical protein
MKPYLAQYLRSRDVERYESFLRAYASSTSLSCRRVLTHGVEILLPSLRQWYPSLSDDEFRRVTYDFAVGLDVPDELPPTWIPDPAEYENDDE